MSTLPPCKLCGKPTERAEAFPSGIYFNVCTNMKCEESSTRRKYEHFVGVTEIEEVRSNPYEPPVYDPVLNDLQRAHQERNDDRLALSNY